MKSACFRDPALIYEAKEAKTCKGCKYEGSEKMFGQTIRFCRLKKRHGTKCGKYVLPDVPVCTESQTEQEDPCPEST